MDRWLKVGEVARLTGLTVRTLHHYDEIGLLVPSGRSAGDYRLYDESDLRRLLAIGHLKSLGLSLEEVAAALDEPGREPAALLEHHVQLTRQRLAETRELLVRLERLQHSAGWDDVVAAVELTGRLRHPDPSVRVRAAMEAPGQAPLADLVDGLREEQQPGVWEMLTWAVAQHGPAATDQVVAHLADPDPRVRLQMAHALGKLRDPRAVPALVGLLRDEDAAVAVKAAFALGQVGGDEALVALAGELGRGNQAHRDTVVTALTRFAGAAFPAVAEALADGDALARAQAAEVLGGLGDPRAARSLATAAADPEPEVALAAVMGLGSTPGEDATAALRRVAAGRGPFRGVAQRLLAPARP